MSDNFISWSDIKKPYLVGIAGGSGSGKTSIANILYESIGLENCLLFSMDNYYKDLTPEQEKNINNYNFDDPLALDLDLLSEHLKCLIDGETIEMPTYSFKLNKRGKETITVKPKKVIVVEGILAFYDQRIRDLMNLKIFIKTDPDISLSRRIYRDIIYRGRTFDNIVERYEKFIKPAYETFIAPTQSYSNIIIPRGPANDVACSILTTHLIYELNKNAKNKKDSICEFKRKKSSFHSLNLNDIFNDKFILIQEKDKKKYLKIFNRYINGDKKPYYNLYMDIFVKEIYSYMFKQSNNNMLIVYLSSDKENLELKLKERKNKNENCYIYICVPIFLRKNEKLYSIIDLIDNSKVIINKIVIVSIFLNYKEAYKNFEKYKTQIEFKSIYESEVLDNFKEYIEKTEVNNDSEEMESIINPISSYTFEKKLQDYFQSH